MCLKSEVKVLLTSSYSCIQLLPFDWSNFIQTLLSQVVHQFPLWQTHAHSQVSPTASKAHPSRWQNKSTRPKV